MRFERMAAPAPDTPLTEVQVEGATFDLREALHFVGLTYGPEDGEVTMGWAARRMIQVRGRGPLAGLTLDWGGVTRCEASFQNGAGERGAGGLDYFEFRHDPEPSLVFFFERGTLRISGEWLAAKLLLDEPGLPPIVQ